MKKLIPIFGLVALAGSLAFAGNETRTLLNEDLPATTTKVFDVGKYDRITVQAVYEDASPSTSTVTDGAKATADITVTDNSSGLISARAATSVSVISTANVSGDSITLNGIVFAEGTDWNVSTTTSTTAENLRARIDAHPDFVATRSFNIVYASAQTVGTFANVWTATSTDQTNLQVSSTTFQGGVDAHSITIAGVTLTEGTDFNANSSSETTAVNIKTAIEADSTLSALIDVATGTGGADGHIIYATATVAGVFPYGISASTSGFSVTPFTQGAESDISVDDDEISETGHGFATGLQIWLNVVSGTAPGGLSDGTTYYAIKRGENAYRLATSAANALAGTDIDITGITGGGSFEFIPGGFVAGSAGFSWDASNDNSNWSDLTSSFSSVTYTADGNMLFDFENYDYRYLRLNYTGPTSGALSLDLILNGKN